MLSTVSLHRLDTNVQIFVQQPADRRPVSLGQQTHPSIGGTDRVRLVQHRVLQLTEARLHGTNLPSEGKLKHRYQPETER